MSNCKVCSEPIVGRGARALYCSQQCASRASKRRARGAPIENDLDDKVCPVCSKVFSPSRNGHTYCSNKCAMRTAWRIAVGRCINDYEPEERPCAICGELFSYRQDRPQQKCCGSQSCAYKHWAIEHAVERKAYRAAWWKRKQEAV